MKTFKSKNIFNNNLTEIREVVNNEMTGTIEEVSNGFLCVSFPSGQKTTLASPEQAETWLKSKKIEEARLSNNKLQPTPLFP